MDHYFGKRLPFLLNEPVKRGIKLPFSEKGDKVEMVYHFLPIFFHYFP